jgi:phosphoglycerate dehydrogenase-like enzyme
MGRKWRVFINEPTDFQGITHKFLEDSGCEVILGRPTWQHPGWRYTADELIEACGSADAVMGASRERYTREFMTSAPRLRVISKYGIGVERIDVRAATELGILVANTPDTHIHTVAEHTIALMLALTKRLFFATDYARKGGWRGPQVETSELFGKTIGIIGMGRIGSAVVERLKGWNVQFLAHDPFKTQQEMRDAGVAPSDLEELLKASDLVSLHVVPNDQTVGMIGERQLRMMKPSAFLINTSRGQVVQEQALVKALQEGWIAGAGLDVVDPEPPSSESALFRMPNVILTPHIAGWSSESVSRFTLKAARNVLAALRGDLPESLVNPEAVPKWRERLERLEQNEF